MVIRQWTCFLDVPFSATTRGLLRKRTYRMVHCRIGRKGRAESSKTVGVKGWIDVGCWDGWRRAGESKPRAPTEPHLIDHVVIPQCVSVNAPAVLLKPMRCRIAALCCSTQYPPASTEC